MENESNLASTNLQPAVSGLAATALMAQAATTGPKWQRYLMTVFAVITLLATAAGIIGNLSSIGSIPGCDAQQTRDTLSDLNIKNKFNASKYNFIKNVSTSDSETTCTANLALWGGGTVEYDYRIFKEDSTIKVQITDVRR
jgi:hypothetical protein